MENRDDLYGKTPFYMTYPIQNLYLAEMEYEKDMERMKELYPREVQQILRLVEQRCDELEREGSRMYDENPDRFMMEQEACRIFQQFLRENPQYENMMPTPQPQPAPMQPMPMPERPEAPRPRRFPIVPPEEFRDMMPEMQPMPMPERPREQQPEMRMQEMRRCGDSWLCHLVAVVFNDEVYRRRCRNRRCRRWSM